MLTECLAAALLLVGSHALAAELYVAPNGDDGGMGTEEQPFATLERARDAVRAIEGGATVVLRGGTYRLTEPLVFTPEDSGTEDAPAVYRSQEGETAVISGGAQVSGWRKHDDRLWVAEVPWAQEREEAFTQLFVDGQRRPRARTPNEGEYFYSKRLHMEGTQCVGMTYVDDDLGAWAEEGDALICLFHNWVNSYNRIGEAEWGRRWIRFTRPAGIFFLGPSVRYYIENVFQALDAPGEWYLDHAEGLLYYYPMPGESMEEAEVVAPAITVTLVELRGEAELGLHVDHVEFRGLSFQHTDADLSADYQHSVQGANTQQGAILARGARNCVIADCEFTRLGEHAVSLQEGCTSNTVTRCHIHDVGGGGVYLSEGAPAVTDEWYLTAHNAVDNNLIHNGGIIFRAGCGVFLGGSASYNQITHNDVSDLSWMGVHLGWSWTGRAPAYTHHNEVGHNHLHHLGNGVLNDIGGIYTLGVSPGTVLHHNLIHDVTRFERGTQGYGGWGIYLDAGSSEMLVENNVVYNTRDGGLHLHCYGHPYGDAVRNNIFAYSDEGGMMRNADHEPDEGIHAHLELNIVYNANQRMLWGSNWAEESKFTADRNIYWSEAGEPDFLDRTFAEWQATGRGANSIIADPGFVDAANRDFGLQPDSPAVELGFEPIDMSTVGLYGDEEWTRLPEGIEHRVVEAAPPPEGDVEGPLAHDFEDYEPGETPAEAVEATENTSVTVTDENPASGVRCLRFVDGPETDVWKPHWFLRRTPGTGGVTVQCSVRLEAERPAMFDLELRDWPRMAGVTYATGPHLRFQADGTVQAADGGEWQIIGRHEVGEWLAVEVSFEEGEGRGDTYAVRIGTETVAEGLAFRSEDFTECNWVGFAGMGEEPGMFFADDVRVE